MKLTQLFFQFGLNITHFSTKNLENGIVQDIFTLETENDDYYIFERIENRLRFEIPEITEITLIEMK